MKGSGIIIVSIVALIGLVAIVMMGLTPLGGDNLAGMARGPLPQCGDHIDNDGDGFCDAAVNRAYCTDGSRLGDPDCTDKNDKTESYVCPSTSEYCDGKDNDCDGLVDDGITCTYYYYCDRDGDGHPSSANSGSCSTYGCVPQNCTTSAGKDCNDADATLSPSATEACDNKDNDCDGMIDEGCGASGTCKELFAGHNDPSADRVNIVFVGHNFASMDAFLASATPAIDLYGNISAAGPGLMELAVYKENAHKFNFWYVDQMFTTATISSCTQCYNSASASYCGGMANTYRANLCANSFRSCAYFGGQSYNSVAYSDWPYTFDHEFQHQFPMLADEYVETGKADSPRSPNCAGDLATAQQWWGAKAGQAGSDGQVVGYNDGCSYVPGNYRATAGSIMRSRGDYRLGLVSEQYVASRIGQYRGTLVGTTGALQVTLEGNPDDPASYTVTSMEAVQLRGDQKVQEKRHKIRIKAGSQEFEQGFDTYDELVIEDFAGERLQLVGHERVPRPMVQVLVPLGAARARPQQGTIELPENANAPFTLTIVAGERPVRTYSGDELRTKAAS